MAGDDRWLVVGLGNPGDDYDATRHNVGADVVGILAGRHGRTLDRNKRIRCRTAELRFGDTRVAVAVPAVYMNTSGGPVQQAANWYSVRPEQVVVCHDDLDLDTGVLRVKRGGGDAGHNGLADIDRALGSREYHRVRIGIGRPPGRMAPRDYVLRRFAPRDREIIDVTLEEAADAVEMLVRDGLEATQNRYHARTAS